MIDINSAVTVEKIAGTDFATGLLLKKTSAASIACFRMQESAHYKESD